DQEDGELVENEEHSVRLVYVSNGVFASSPYSTSSMLQHMTSSSKSGFLTSSSNWVKKFGFQDQEDGELVENEERSVRLVYVSTGIFASSPYSTSNPLQSPTSSSKSNFLTSSNICEGLIMKIPLHHQPPSLLPGTLQSRLDIRSVKMLVEHLQAA